MRRQQPASQYPISPNQYVSSGPLYPPVYQPYARVQTNGTLETSGD